MARPVNGRAGQAELEVEGERRGALPRGRVPRRSAASDALGVVPWLEGADAKGRHWSKDAQVRRAERVCRRLRCNTG
jgi:hypothetical protein